MRATLVGLTTRGRCFIAAGLACALSALLLGEKDLLRVAVFLVALPLIAAVLVSRTQFLLSCHRSVAPARVAVGDPAVVSLTLDNLSRAPTGVLLLEDTLPFTLGERPRVVIDRIPARGSQSVQYPVGAALRGRYRLGPLRLRLTDPFGMVELSRGFTATDTLTVYPTVHPLPPVGLGGAWSTGGDSSSRSVSIQGDDDAATREYRHGDDLRKVHWRSTARVGKVMVRREEQPWQTRSALFLDRRLARHGGEGAGASFEYAVSATASIGVHLGRIGYSLRLFDQHTEVRTGADMDFSDTQLLLETLATTTTSSDREIVGGVEALRQSGEDGLLVAVLGDVGPDEVATLAAGRAGTTTSIAVLLDIADWVGGDVDPRRLTDRHEAAIGVLRRSGWRVVVGRRGTPISAAWAQAGVSAYAFAGPTVPTTYAAGAPEAAPPSPGRR